MEAGERMKILYNGADLIASGQKPQEALTIDRAGGEADSLSVIFPDPKGTWASWGAARGDTARLISDTLDTGVMWVDNPSELSGAFRFDATSIHPNARLQRARIWRDIKLSEIISDVAGHAQLTPSIQNGVIDWSYKAISQNMETDLAFLVRICAREGYAVKATGGQLVVYDEQRLESVTPSVTLAPQDVSPGYGFEDGTGLLSEATVVYYNVQKRLLIKQTVTDANTVGGTIQRTEMVSDDGEAQRFAWGALRMANKWRRVGVFALNQMTNLAAGSTVALSGFPGSDNGAWFVYQTVYDAMQDKMRVYVRRPLAY